MKPPSLTGQLGSVPVKMAGALLLLTAVVVPLAAKAQTFSLISTDAVWKYLDTGTNLGTAWRAPDFDDFFFFFL